MKRLHLSLGIFLILSLVLTSFLAACGSPAPTTTAPTTTAPTTTAPTTTKPTTTAPTTTTAAVAKPTGNLNVAISDLGDGSFLPWIGQQTIDGQFFLATNDLLVYGDETTYADIPGLATSWEVSPDALTTTFRLRKGVQWSGGYGEVTSEDVKFTFERLGAPDVLAPNAYTRQIASMDTPDPYTLVCKLKAPSPFWWKQFSFSRGARLPIASKKYIQAVGEKVAAYAPVGSGPFNLKEYKPGTSCVLEAKDTHWRAVPEFKTVTMLSVPELATVVAMLKTKSIDIGNTSAELVPDIKAAGLDAETSPYGGSVLAMPFGGIFIPADAKRYNAAIHNQDPWVDIRVRQAMNISIDRAAIIKAIYRGNAMQTGFAQTQSPPEYFYPFDQPKARQLLTEAGYPNGFSFKVYSWARPGAEEMPRVIEAVTAYWKQIGLNPQIVNFDFTIYAQTHWATGKTAGEMVLHRIIANPDIENTTNNYFMPNGNSSMFEDATYIAMANAASQLGDLKARQAAFDKMNLYLYNNYAVVPVVKIGYNFAWNPQVVAPFPHQAFNAYYYLEYVRHAQPLNTFRLFTPWPGR